MQWFLTFKVGRPQKSDEARLFNNNQSSGTNSSLQSSLDHALTISLATSKIPSFTSLLRLKRLVKLNIKQSHLMDF